jgi:hypothetical protein
MLEDGLADPREDQAARALPKKPTPDCGFMDDALRAPAGLPWITMTPLSTAPTFAHNLHSLHHYEKEPLKAKIQGRKPRNGPVQLAQQRWLWGLLA